jgi:galactokinase
MTGTLRRTEGSDPEEDQQGGAAEERAFRQVFGVAPQARAVGPGRVNLLGEHTDYNDGYVLPTPLPHQTVVLAAPADDRIEAHAEEFGQTLSARHGEGRANTWLDYVLGCVWALRAAGFGVPGGRLYIRRGVPMGAGLASSAALEVAVLRAIRALYRLPLDDLALALAAHRAEVEYVGVRCGIMDQIVASVGRPGEALFLDARSLHREPVPVPEGWRFVVVDSGVRRRLADAGYNLRRAQCERASRLLGVRALRDIALVDLDRAGGLPEPLDRRVRHVVTENARVLAGVDALKAGSMVSFGRLMNESHRSLRDDYEVSTAALDRLVGLALAHGAWGARLTGAGFGGCIVALVREEDTAALIEGVAGAYPDAAFWCSAHGLGRRAGSWSAWSGWPAARQRSRGPHAAICGDHGRPTLHLVASAPR